MFYQVKCIVKEMCCHVIICVRFVFDMLNPENKKPKMISNPTEGDWFCVAITILPTLSCRNLAYVKFSLQ